MRKRHRRNFSKKPLPVAKKEVRTVVLKSAAKPNRNGRIWSSEALYRASQQLNGPLGERLSRNAFIGEMGHPITERKRGI